VEDLPVVLAVAAIFWLAGQYPAGCNDMLKTGRSSSGYMDPSGAEISGSFIRLRRKIISYATVLIRHLFLLTLTVPPEENDGS